MKKSAKIWLTIGCIVIGVVNTVVMLFVCTLPWSALYIGLIFSEAPPEPEVAYGEFPFKLVYEINGEQITIEDTLVIEYEGIGMNEGSGKYLKWNRYLKSQRELDVLYLFDGLDNTMSSVSVAFVLGSCEYYMGLEETEPYYLYNDISAGDIVLYSSEYTGRITEKELYDRFNIIIIEKSIAEPLS